MKKIISFFVCVIGLVATFFCAHFTVVAAASEKFGNPWYTRYLILVFMVFLPEILILVLNEIVAKKIGKKMLFVHYIQMFSALLLVLIYVNICWSDGKIQEVELAIPWVIIFMINVFCVYNKKR